MIKREMKDKMFIGIIILIFAIAFTNQIFLNQLYGGPNLEIELIASEEIHYIGDEISYSTTLTNYGKNPIKKDFLVYNYIDGKWKNTAMVSLGLVQQSNSKKKIILDLGESTRRWVGSPSYNVSGTHLIEVILSYKDFKNPLYPLKNKEDFYYQNFSFEVFPNNNREINIDPNWDLAIYAKDVIPRERTNAVDWTYDYSVLGNREEMPQFREIITFVKPDGSSSKMNTTTNPNDLACGVCPTQGGVSSLKPENVGINKIIYILDPENKVPEKDETNNRGEISYEYDGENISNIILNN